MVPAVIFSAISLLGFALTCYLAWSAIRMRRSDRERRQLLRDGVQVTGTVISAKVANREDSPEIRPEVHFLTVTGHEYNVATFETWPAVVHEGQSVLVAYDPNDPDRMTLARSRPGTKFSYLLAMTALLGGLTLVTAFFSVRLWAVASGHGFDLPGVDVPGVVLPSNR